MTRQFDNRAAAGSGPSSAASVSHQVPVRAPQIVGEVLGSPGAPLEDSSHAALAPRFGRDFSQVRVHTGGRAAESARAVGADAYTVGNDIVFAAGQYAPGTSAGDRLLAHELTHVAQHRHATPAPGPIRIGGQDDHAEREADSVAAGQTGLVGAASGPPVLRRQIAPEPAADLAVRFSDAVAKRNWANAVRALTKMSAADQRAELEALDPATRGHLRSASARLDPSPDNQLVHDIEALDAAPPGLRDTQAPQAQVEPDVAAMSVVRKLLKAAGYAEPHLAPDAWAQVKALFTPQSLGIMGAFAVLYIAAQWSPAGWVADGIALATLTVSVFFAGMTVLRVAANFGRFLAAAKATTDQDLRVAGEALSQAIIEGGFALLMVLLSRVMGRSVSGRGPGTGGGRPYEGPPPTGYVDAVTEAGLVRMPVAAAAVVPKTASAMQRLASLAVITPPVPGGPGVSEGPASSGGSGGSGGSTPGPTPSKPSKGPEIWEEISEELQLDPASTKAGPVDVATAVRDARAAGLTGPPGKPGTVDLATQPHRAAPAARRGYGVSGKDVQSAHLAPTSFMRKVPGYSRDRADTVLLDRATHAAFDRYWQNWAMDQRRAGRPATKPVTASEMYEVMLKAIDQIPNIEQRTKNAMAWRLYLELFRDHGLTPKSFVDLPYPNMTAAPSGLLVPSTTAPDAETR
ncbi:DUF4157 domain-containing protein [Amycolatopsis sp. NPDC059021]|uniref:eCIS core domain-containing protein n=1 Tax=Amycolatopsis sp. NPDC059021 TaxID=3346704 RepID=UPI003671CBE4